MGWRSYILVAVQLSCIGWLVITGPWLARHWEFLLLEFLGLALGIWALLAMNLHSLTVFPDVKTGSLLITHGPYRIIRHPMYTAVLLVTLALVLDVWSLSRLGVWLLLLCDLMLKLSYEEGLLIQHFEGYQEYQRRTTRLVPFLF